MTSDELDEYLKELREAVSVAGLNHQIWWVYKSKDTRHQFIKTMRRFNLFFQTSEYAHFVTLLVGLYRLYETRTDTYNIPTFLKRIREFGHLPESSVSEAEEIYLNQAKPLWIKVSILRNEAYGHRSSTSTMAEIYQKAGVSPNELHELMEVTKKLLNTLSHAWDNSSHAFNLGSKDATIRMLKALESEGGS
ncbi:MAG: hypothetical protein U5O39_19905 [Gammaproteobacteria bacterium]|nr:hypothetical protein [Gammaproteobacteria bacterium]